MISETRTLLGVVLVGTMMTEGRVTYGLQGIPKLVVPVNTPAWLMTKDEVQQFHLNADQRPQFTYYSHLLRCGGHFAADLLQQILTDLIEQTTLTGSDQRALELLRKELCWKSTMGAMR